MWLIKDQRDGKTGPSQRRPAALHIHHPVRKRKLDIVISPALNELKIRIGNYLPKRIVCIPTDSLQKIWGKVSGFEIFWKLRKNILKSWESFWNCILAWKPDLCSQMSHCSAFQSMFVWGFFYLCEQTVACLWQQRHKAVISFSPTTVDLGFSLVSSTTWYVSL